MNSGPSYTSSSSESSGFLIDKLSIETSSGKAVKPNSRDTPFPLKTVTTKGMLDSVSFFSLSSASSPSFSSGVMLGMSTLTVITSSSYCLFSWIVLSPALSSISKGNPTGISTWKSYTKVTNNGEYQKQLFSTYTSYNNLLFLTPDKNHRWYKSKREKLSILNFAARIHNFMCQEKLSVYST